MQNRITKIVKLFLAEISNNQDNPLLALEGLSQKLLDRGFSEQEIKTALDWILNHIDSERVRPVRRPTRHLPAIRYLNQMELDFFTPQAHNYLIQLQSLRVLNPLQVEQIIESCILLGYEKVDLDDVKAVVTQMVLGREPGNFDTDAIFYPGNDRIN